MSTVQTQCESLPLRLARGFLDANGLVEATQISETPEAGAIEAIGPSLRSG